MSENKNKIEMHDCIVCAKTFKVLVLYTPEGRLVDYIVTDSGGHRVAGERRPMAVCDLHTDEEIEIAYQKWQSVNGRRLVKISETRDASV